MPRIALISDTHGLLRPEVRVFLNGADYIIHAGDTGDADILSQLAAIAPVTAVRGNVDKGAWAAGLSETEVLEVAGISIYVLHDLGALDLDPAASGFKVVVSGHTHQSAFEVRNGVIFLNPGSCGPRRFKLPVSVAEIVICDGIVKHRIVELELSGA
jgi:putative phosphoesterase